MDHYTGYAASPRRDSGWTFASYGEMFASRSDGSPFGAVRFDEKLGRFQLSGASGYEVSTRAQEADGPLARLRLVAEGTPLQQRQRAFQAPSNLLYLPAEYAAINCCPICAYGPDHPPCEPCYEDPPPPPPDPIPTVVINPGFDFAFVGTDPTVPRVARQAVGNPQGGTYSWSASNTKVSFDNPNQEVVRLTGNSQSSSLLDTTLSVVYTVANGIQSNADTRAVTVRVFKFLQQSGSTQNSFIRDANGNATGYQASVIYNIKTQPGSQLLEPGFSGISVPETVTITSVAGVPPNISVNLITQTGATFPNSEIVDQFGFDLGSPLQPDFEIVANQGIFLAGIFVRNNTLTFRPSGLVVVNNGPLN